MPRVVNANGALAVATAACRTSPSTAPLRRASRPRSARRRPARDTRVLGGFALRFYARVADHYGAPVWALKGPEPHVAERLLVEALERAGVDVRLGAETPAAAVSIDASYGGGLMAHPSSRATSRGSRS